MSPDQHEKLAHAERTAFCGLFTAMMQLADTDPPFGKEACHRRHIALMHRENWMRALRELDAQP